NPVNATLLAVASNGSVICAAGYTGADDAFLISSAADAVTWVERSTTASGTTSGRVNGIVFASTLGLFVAVAGTALGDLNIITSPDGVTWTRRVTALSPLYAIAWSGSLLVAVGYGQTAPPIAARVVTSTDGLTWTEENGAQNYSLRGVAWSSALGLFVAAGDANGTNPHIASSPDAVTWTTRTPTIAKNIGLNAVVWGSDLSLFVAVGDADGTDAYVLTSPDGVVWTERSNPKNFALNSVIWTGKQFLACGNADGTDAYIITSLNGVTWTEVANPKNFALNSAAWDGTRYVLVGAADGTDAYIITSTDDPDAYIITSF
ncbi:MAG: hypothetical protein ACYCZR_09790, partial [Burkholderiales bacterium]